MAQQGHQRPVRARQCIQAHHSGRCAGQRCLQAHRLLCMRGQDQRGRHTVPLRQRPRPRSRDFRTRAGCQLQPLLYPDRRTAWERTILRLFFRLWLAGGYWHRPARRDQAQRILYSRPDGSGKRFCIRKRTRIYLIFWLKCSIMKAKKMGHGGDYEIT